MILEGVNARATGVFYTMISGDRQDLKRMLARVQDNAEELLALIRENVTEEQAMRYGFITNIVKALEMRGYGRRILFREDPLPALSRAEAITPEFGSLSYGIPEKKDLAACIAMV